MEKFKLFLISAEDCNVFFSGKYSGQKSLFIPLPPKTKTLIFSLFFRGKNHNFQRNIAYFAYMYMVDLIYHLFCHIYCYFYVSLWVLSVKKTCFLRFVDIFCGIYSFFFPCFLKFSNLAYLSLPPGGEYLPLCGNVQMSAEFGQLVPWWCTKSNFENS